MAGKAEDGVQDVGAGPDGGRCEGRGRIPCDLLRARRQRLRWDAHRDRSVRQAAHPRIGLGGRRHRLEGLAAAEAPFEGLVLEGLGGRRVGRAAAVAAAGAHGLGGLAIGGPTPLLCLRRPEQVCPCLAVEVACKFEQGVHYLRRRVERLLRRGTSAACLRTLPPVLKPHLDLARR